MDRLWSNLRKEILSKLKNMEGDVGFYFKNLVNGEVISYNDEKKFLAASIVKLPLLVAIFLMKEKGETSFDEKITIREDEKMPASGAIRYMTGEVTLDVITLCKLMIVISDTTAANVLFKHYGAEKISRAFHELGLKDTQFNRAYFDSEKEKRGINNYFVPWEIGNLLEKIYNRTLVSKEASKMIEDILLKQQINSKICGYLPMGFPVAHKTGEEENKTHDVGIVFAKEPFIVCFASYRSNIPEFEDFIRQTTAALVRFTDPKLEGYKNYFKAM